MIARFLYLSLISIIAISLYAPNASAQAELVDTDDNNSALLFGGQVQEDAFTPPYKAEIDAFNALSDEELITALAPELNIAPSDDELSDNNEDAALMSPDTSDTPVKTHDATITQEDLERYALVPQSVFDDAQDFFNFCETSPSLNIHYQCQCWAKRYLDEAINIGPGYTRDNVMRVINNDCLDVPRMAGISFNQCINQSLVKPDGKSMEEYCTCYGNAYARNISEGTMSMSSRKISGARSLAIEACL